ncbi:MAG: phosphoenolpyruvate-utilizing N-terminal domain-containing protein, partial [Mariprofundaceae bacterium]
MAGKGVRASGRAVAASSGVVIGRVQRLIHGRMPIPERRIPDGLLEAEVQRLDRAVAQAMNELIAEREQLARAGARDPELILEAHMMMLSDPELIDHARVRILEQRINAEWALRQQMDAIEAVFDTIEDDYLRDRREDVEQVGARVLRHLSGETPEWDALADGEDPLIVVGEDFSVSDVVRLWRMGAAGIVAEEGGGGSHALILARGIGLPALVGAEGVLDAARDGDRMILDGEQGIWVLNPDWSEQRSHLRFAEAMAVYHDRLMAFAGQPSVSADGRAMALMGNIEFPEEMLLARRIGVDGIGLYRTEFLFMNAAEPPDEARQRREYARVIE